MSELSNPPKGVDRLARWKADAQAARPLQPKLVEGKNARYAWLDSLYEAADIPSTARHVAMVLVMAGNVDGTSIFPGSRLIAARCGLSQRVVLKSITLLVRRARLLRKTKGAAGPGAGCEYLLAIPGVLTEDQHRVLTENKHLAPELLIELQHPSQVLTDGQHRADFGAQGADADDSKVLTLRQHTSPSTSPSTSADEASAVPGELAKARPGAGKTMTRRSREPLEERLRKAVKHISADPAIDDDTIARMYALGPDEIRKVRAA